MRVNPPELIKTATKIYLSSVDNESLLELLNEDRQRQFWIKPWGDPDRPADQREDFDNLNIRVLFAKQPIGVEIGDILFVHRLRPPN